MHDLSWERVIEHLDELSGFGRGTWRKLRAHFSSAGKLVTASAAEIAKVDSIGPAKARRLRGALDAFVQVQVVEHNPEPSDAVASPKDDTSQLSMLFAAIVSDLDDAQLVIQARRDEPLFPKSRSRYILYDDGRVDIGGEILGLPHGLIPNPSVRTQPHMGAHGLMRFKQGCRCAKCSTAWVDALGATAERLAGHTLERIARRIGLTRERVRQLTMQMAPWEPWQAVRTERLAMAEEIQAVLSEVECETCGHPFSIKPGERDHRKYCSRTCREAYESLRYHLDDERRLKQRVLIARWALENPDRASELQIRHARRVIEHGPEHGSGKRWLIEGSTGFEVAVTAFCDGWPVFDELPAQIQVQIRDHVGVPVDDDLRAAATAHPRLADDRLAELDDLVDAYFGDGSDLH